MPNNNIENIARIPIILKDLKNVEDAIKNKELVMDYENNDIYVMVDGELISITKLLRDTIETINDGSVVFHIVTEDTLPPVKDRVKNHWYFVIVSSKNKETGSDIEDLNTYIYYGVAKNDFELGNDFMLISQNMITDTSIVKIDVQDRYIACFYVPTRYIPTFTDADGVEMKFKVVKRLYILTPDNTTVEYDAYVSEESGFGEKYVTISISTTRELTNIE